MTTDSSSSSSVSSASIIMDIDDDGSENNNNDGATPASSKSSSKRKKNSTNNNAIVARKETRAVNILRFITLLVLVVATFLCSYGIYILVKSSQREAFEQEYYAQSNKIIESFHTSVEEFMGSFDSLSSSITSYAQDTNSIFPNVTISDFDIRGSSARIQAQGTFIQYMPYVTDDTRKGWEEYASSNQDYLMPSFLREQKLIHYQDIQFGYATPSPPRPAEEEGNGDVGDVGDVDGEPGQRRNLILQRQGIENEEEFKSSRKLQLESINDQSFREEIWGTTGNGETEMEGTGPYLPIWQLSPSLPLINLLNMNTLDLIFFEGAYKQSLNQSQASLGIMTQLNDPTDENGESIKVLNALLSQGQYRHDLDEYTRDPITSFAYPVFDNFDPTKRQVVGILGSALYWKLLFTNVLADSESTIVDVVISNSIGQAVTYRLEGSEATYIDSTDTHNTNYDDMVQTANIANYVTSKADVSSRSYTAVDLNSNYVDYYIEIYPTESMEDNYVDQTPIFYALAVLSIFIFTAFVFILYNYLVEKRQKLVLDRAVKSSAVVDSLFPANVQKRLYDEANKNNNSNKGNSSTKKTSSSIVSSSNHDDKRRAFHNDEANAGRLSRFLSSAELVKGTSTNSVVNNNNDNNVNDDEPIADLFPNATVFFADLVGFTKWSSTKSPTEVFGLLEGIYGKFDQIAIRRQVFKVETIGDCYVAVTGVPETQIDHAILMAKFAAECLVNLRQILIKMSHKLGSDDCLDLNMRIGIHSGPVTAGVLRGARARFQLFGDTVNTAARMESNGSPGRIQCSQATADLLIVANKIGWLKPREDCIDAKGKGRMRTFWIEPSKSKTAVTTTQTENNIHHSEAAPPAPALNATSSHDILASA